MTEATVHYLPSAGASAKVDQDQDHAADIAALVEEIGTLAMELADEQAQHASTRVELQALRAAFAPRSDERDQWQARALSYYADGYRAGFGEGEQVGAERAILAWKVTAWDLPEMGGPSCIELDRRRYPPDGRLSWIIPKDGE